MIFQSPMIVARVLVFGLLFSSGAYAQTIGQPEVTAQVREIKPADAEVLTSPLFDFFGKVTVANNETTLSVEVRGALK